MSNGNSNFFNPAAFSALGEEQRKAMTAAFDAMSNWRQEMNSMQEKNSAAVFDKMSGAAKSLGWPTEFVDLTRQQIQNVSKLQSQAIEQVMDVWEKQATAAANAGGKLEMPKFPGFGNMPNFPGMPQFGGSSGNSTFPGMPDMTTPMMPMQLWMQAAEMWQKSFQQAIETWSEAQKSMLNAASGASKPDSNRR